MKILDIAGLQYFWTKIKALLLGKANDGDVVHKTGNESVSGTKTFSSQIVGTIGKSHAGYVDMLRTYQSDNSNYRSCTIRCTNGNGYNEILIGAHDESDGTPAGLAIRNTGGSLETTLPGALHLTRPNDASGTADNAPPLTVGPVSGEHLELDGNEIMAKASGTTTGPLYINLDGGDVYIGGAGANYKSVTGRGKGSSTVPVYTNADGVVTACGSSLDVDITGNAGTATKLATARTINGVSFDGSANITVADNTKVSKSGDTMTGALNGQANNVNIAVEPVSQKEDWRFYITKNAADTTHTGNLLRLGVAQMANAKDYRVLLGVPNPRAGNLPTSASIAGETDDSDASTSNCWGSIGLFYDYSKNRTFPVLFNCSAYPTDDNSGDSIATTAWVRTATGNFACNAATATAFSSSKSVVLTGAVTGTVSSTGGWTVPTIWRSCLLGRNDSGTSNPWYKVASRNLSAGNVSFSITFFVENCNTANKFSGILHISLSTNSNRMIISANTAFRWVANNGFSLEDFVLVCPDTAEPTVEIWAKFAAGYLKRRFVVISEGTHNNTSIGWTLYSGTSAGQEASIPTAGTQVVSLPSLLEQRVKALEDAMQ